MHEALGIQQAWITHNFWWPFLLHFSTIFKHLPSHLSNRLLAIFFELDESSYDIIFELADELFCWVTNRVYVSEFCQ